MKILENTTHCPDCGGCGVVFFPDKAEGKMLERCDFCCKFKNDAEACEAAKELIKVAWDNHARAMQVGSTQFSTIHNCEECPMFKRMPEEHDIGMYDFCGMVEEDIEYEYPSDSSDSVWENCPLKKVDMYIRYVDTQPDPSLPIAEVGVCNPFGVLRMNHKGHLLCLCPECDKEHEKPVDPDPAV